MVLRGIAARRLLSFTIFALTAAVVSGAVSAVGFSRLTHISQGSAGALVLLGLVALAAQSTESIRRREHELALARLRGRSGFRLLVFAVAEPGLVVVAGAIVGVAAGWLVAKAAAGAWLPSPAAAFELSRTEWAAAGVVTAGSLLVVAASSWRMIRTPLQTQLVAARRPQRVGTLGLFAQLLLVLGAAVAIYQAHQDASSRVDWVSLVSPAVVGLAAGQVLVWLLMAIFGLVVPRSGGARLGWFITLRRLLRRADSLALIRIVVAAGVVFGVAVSASAAAQSWRDERAKLQVGAPLSYPVTGGALRAYAAADTADPQGHWLMPVASYTTDSDPSSRRVFVGVARWQSVVGDFFAGTPAASLGAALTRFPPAPPNVYVHARSAAVSVTAGSSTHARGVGLVFQYVNDVGNLMVLDLPLRPGDGVATGNGLITFSRPIPDCALSCDVVELDISGYTRGPLSLVDASFGDARLLAASSGISLPGHADELTVQRAGAGVAVNIPKAPFQLGNDDRKLLGSFRSTGSVSAVATPTASFVQDSDGHRAVPGVDGSPHPVTVTERVTALPFVGTKGSLLDLASILRGSGGSVPTTVAAVLARADTPASVVAALRATGAVGQPRTYSAERQRLGQTPRAQGTRLYVVTAGFAALIALLSLLAAVAQQRPERRQEAASLRSIGISARQINGAYRRETLLLSLATFVGVCAAAWLSCRVLLAALPLVSGWAFAPPLDASPRLGWIGITAVVAAVAVAVIGYGAFRRIGRASSPRLLREDIA